VDIVHPDVDRYLDALLPAPHAVFREMEAIAGERDFPIVGPQVGRLLHFASTAAGARRVFEMGSGFGYSTLWFALAVGDGGEVHHTDASVANSRLARELLAKAGVADRVTFHVGDAIASYRATPGAFDVVFVDVDKHGYPEAFRAASERQRTGELLIVDNLLWDGRVLRSDSPDSDRDTAGIRAFTRAVLSDRRYDATIVPVRDGVLLARRSH
jgi:predicted O-methyltransferase YrrM